MNERVQKVGEVGQPTLRTRCIVKIHWYQRESVSIERAFDHTPVHRFQITVSERFRITVDIVNVPSVTVIAQQVFTIPSHIPARFGGHVIRRMRLIVHGLHLLVDAIQFPPVERHDGVAGLVSE